MDEVTSVMVIKIRITKTGITEVRGSGVHVLPQIIKQSEMRSRKKFGNQSIFGLIS